MARFGEQRLLRGRLERQFFRVFGVPDPAHYLRHRYLARALRAFEPRPRRILDAGSGRGDHTLWLARRYPLAEVLGLDIDEARVERSIAAASALGIGNVEFRHADLCDLNLTGFDLVVSIDVLEHVPGQEDVLRRLRDALEPGGLAFYHIPCERPKPVLLSRYLQRFHDWAEEEHVEDDLAPEEFVERVTVCGLEVLEARRTFARWTGEAACSLFALPYANTPLNRVAQVALTPVCKVLAMSDTLGGGARYALAVTARKPASDA